MLKLYHVPGTRSVRPLWLAYELDLEVEVEFIDFSTEYRATPEWRQISPAGKVPVLVDDQASAEEGDQKVELTLMESGAMVSYVLDAYGHGRLRPSAGTRESALFHQWCWFAEATLTRPLGAHRIARAHKQPVEVLVAESKEKVELALAAVEQTLAHSRYMVGDVFTAADIMMGYSIGLLEHLLQDGYPKLVDYLDRMRERPALQRALALKP